MLICVSEGITQRGQNRCIGRTVDARVADISAKSLCTWPQGPESPRVQWHLFMVILWQEVDILHCQWNTFNKCYMHDFTELLFHKRGQHRHDNDVNIYPLTWLHTGRKKNKITPLIYFANHNTFGSQLTRIIWMAINIYSVQSTV